MTEFILTLVLNSLYIYGLWYSMGEGMILEPIVKYLKKAPKAIHKPLFDCPICMASIHSYLLPIAVVFGFVEPIYLLAWIFYIIMMAGLNGIIASLQPDVKEKQDLPILGMEYMLWKNGQYLGFAKYEEDPHHGRCFIAERFINNVPVKKVFIADKWELL